MPVERELPILAVTERKVIDTVRLKVRASSDEEAKEKARLVLEQFPDAHEVDGVSYVYIENRRNGPSEVLSVELDLGENDAGQ